MQILTDTLNKTSSICFQTEKIKWDSSNIHKQMIINVSEIINLPLGVVIPLKYIRGVIILLVYKQLPIRPDHIRGYPEELWDVIAVVYDHILRISRGDDEVDWDHDCGDREDDPHDSILSQPCVVFAYPKHNMNILILSPTFEIAKPRTQTSVFIDLEVFLATQLNIERFYKKIEYPKPTHGRLQDMRSLFCSLWKGKKDKSKLNKQKQYIQLILLYEFVIPVVISGSSG